ncbi:MAG: hypothetical protein MO853_09580 [Candidatus Protistobacter heckmanni]|nr:hypothetical protein [Candidatus Protistobacter heckmanni]
MYSISAIDRASIVTVMMKAATKALLHCCNTRTTGPFPAVAPPAKPMPS